MSYITLEDLKVEGVAVSDYRNDNYVQGRITLAQEFIEEVLGRFFEPRVDYQILTDGTGHNTLFLPVPPVSETAITEVTISDEVLDSQYYQYPLPRFPDGRKNPKLIKLGGSWPKPGNSGELNIKITGTFGFVESDGISTPPLIKDLCKRITIWALPPITDAASARNSHIIEEELGDYRYRLSDLAQRGGLFNDPKIDNVIAMFKKRTVIAI